MNKIDSDQEVEHGKNLAFEQILESKGGNKAAIGRKLGNVSGQLLGQYVSGRQKPKEDFFKKWDDAYKEDIRWAFETNVSEINSLQSTIKNPTIESLARTLEMNAKARLVAEESRKIAEESRKIDMENRKAESENVSRLIYIIEQNFGTSKPTKNVMGLEKGPMPIKKEEDSNLG